MGINLSIRLQSIADCIPDCQCVADIGTDHALLPIYLTQKGICQKAIACDIKEGPLKRASSNLKQYGNEKVEIRKGKGLKPLRKGEADLIVIAGMSGTTISDILHKGKDTSQSTPLILQPVQSDEFLRRYLWNNGYEIISEKYVKDYKTYVIMQSIWTGGYSQYCSIDYIIGKHERLPKDKEFADYVLGKIKKYRRMSEGLKKSADSKRNTRMVESTSVLKRLVQVLINIRTEG